MQELSVDLLLLSKLQRTLWSSSGFSQYNVTTKKERSSKHLNTSSKLLHNIVLNIDFRRNMRNQQMEMLSKIKLGLVVDFVVLS